MTVISHRLPSSLVGAAVLAVAALGLTGCQMGSIQLSGGLPADRGEASAGGSFSGIVHGGQQPIYNSVIQLYAAGAPAAPTSGNPTGGLGQGATALIPVGSMTVGSTNNYYQGGAANCAYTTGNPLGCTALPATSAGGSFTISGYTCPSSTAETYIVATGGDSSGATTNNNTAIALMAALGPCGNLSSATTIIMNEITTVAAVYSLNQFMAAPSGTAAANYSSQGGATSGIAVNIGASSGPVGGYGTAGIQTQQVGMVNGFRMVNNLSDYTQGTANPIAANTWSVPTGTNPAGSMTVSLANAIAACVNTTSSTSTTCTNLVTYSKEGSYTPADTIQALWLTARYPQTSNSTNFFNLGSGTPPFGGGLATSAGQLTIEVGFKPLVPGGNSLNALGAYAISNPSAGAFDEYGHLWMINMNPQSTSAATATPNDNVFVSEIDANGNYLSGPFNSYTAHGGYQVSSADPCASTYTHYLAYNGSSTVEGMAIDQTNTVWVTNQMEYTTSTGGIAGGNCSSNAGYSLMRITGSSATGTGAAVTTGYYAKNSLEALTVDANDNVWAPPISYSAGGAPIISFTNSGTFSTGAYNIESTGSGAAVDAAGNIWTAASDTCGLYGGIIFQGPVSSVASPTLTGGYYSANDANCPATSTASPALDDGTQTVNNSANLGEPQGIAVDANNGIWVADYKNPTNSGNSTITYLLPSSSSWSTGGTQGAPNTATPIPVAAALGSSTTGNANGLSSPYALAVDGSNNVWVANNGNERPSEFSVTVSGGNISSIQPVTAAYGGSGSGLVLPQTQAIPYIPGSGPNWVGVDPSGNVWFLSPKLQTNGSTNQANWVTVIVGAATPVITPLAYQVEYSRIGQTPQ